jgi:hypothetical protein
MKSKFKVYYGKDADDIAESIKGNVPEDHQKKLMELINTLQENADHETGDDITNQKTKQERHIIIVRTAQSTILMPVLMKTNKQFSLSFDITLQESKKYHEDSQRSHENDLLSYVVCNQDGTIKIDSNIKNGEALLPMLIIPHECEGNDNDAALTQIIDFLKLVYPDNISLIDIDQIEEINMTTKALVIRYKYKETSNVLV